MTRRRTVIGTLRWLAPVLSVSILGAMAAQPMLHGKPADADAYHARVRAVAATIPLQMGDWEGTDIAVPPAATKMLRPNVIISRRYRNVRTGAFVEVLFTQCEDSRYLAGHYPPNCYPGNGWTLVAGRPTNWQVDAMAIGGMEYEFVMHGALKDGHIFAANFMMLPDGSFVRDMAEYRRRAFDYRNRYYGAAQMQVVFDGNTLPEDRRAGTITFVKYFEPLIHILGTGEKK